MHFGDRLPKHCLGRNARDRLGGRVPELKPSLRVDQEDAIGHVVEHPRRLPALLGFATRRTLAREEDVALLAKANPCQRVLDALGNRLEQCHFAGVEWLVV